jgi:hypothetical protein
MYNPNGNSKWDFLHDHPMIHDQIEWKSTFWTIYNPLLHKRRIIKQHFYFGEEAINAGLDFPASHNDHHFVRDSNDNKQWQFRICKGQYNQHLAIINQQGAQQG